MVERMTTRCFLKNKDVVLGLAAEPVSSLIERGNIVLAEKKAFALCPL